MSILCHVAAQAVTINAEPEPVDFGTPRPVYTEPTPPVPLAQQQPRMDHHEKMRLRAAAFRATRLYPGPVGELLSREILTWEEFGYRLGGSQLVMRLVDHILKAPQEQPR